MLQRLKTFPPQQARPGRSKIAARGNFLRGHGKCAPAFCHAALRLLRVNSENVRCSNKRAISIRLAPNMPSGKRILRATNAQVCCKCETPMVAVSGTTLDRSEYSGLICSIYAHMFDYEIQVTPLQTFMMARIRFIQPDGSGIVANIDGGTNVMRAAIRNGISSIDTERCCCLDCATGHVYVKEGASGMSAPSQPQELERPGSIATLRQSNSRLSSQLMLPPSITPLTVHSPQAQS